MSSSSADSSPAAHTEEAEALPRGAQVPRASALGPPRRMRLTAAAAARRGGAAPPSSSSSSAASPVSQPPMCRPLPHMCPNFYSSSSSIGSPPTPVDDATSAVHAGGAAPSGGNGSNGASSSRRPGNQSLAARAGAVARRLAAASSSGSECPTPASAGGATPISAAALTASEEAARATATARGARPPRRAADLDALLEVSRNGGNAERAGRGAPGATAASLKSTLTARLEEEKAAGQRALAAARAREERLRLDLARRDALAIAGRQQAAALRQALRLAHERRGPSRPRGGPRTAPVDVGEAGHEEEEEEEAVGSHGHEDDATAAPRSSAARGGAFSATAAADAAGAAFAATATGGSLGGGGRLGGGAVVDDDDSSIGLPSPAVHSDVSSPAAARSGGGRRGVTGGSGSPSSSASSSPATDAAASPRVPSASSSPSLANTSPLHQQQLVQLVKEAGAGASVTQWLRGRKRSRSGGSGETRPSDFMQLRGALLEQKVLEKCFEKLFSVTLSSLTGF